MNAIPGDNQIPTCHRGLENLDEEHDYWIDEVDGDLPDDLQGTFLEMVQDGKKLVRPPMVIGLMAMA